MWIFLVLVIFGLLFMLYALVQFTLESKRKLGPRNRGSSSKTGNTLARGD
jgi:threonine/homoserine/homoserine lactone efflux protein